MPAVFDLANAHKSVDHLVIEQGLNLIQQALSIFNAEMKLVSCNQRFIELFELSDNLVLPGVSFYDLNLFLAKRGEFGPGDPGELAEQRTDRARRFEPHYFERTRPNGKRISVEGHPLDSGGWITIYSDITEFWRNEQVLKARGDALSNKLLRRTSQLSESNRELAATNRALQKAKLELQTSESRLRAITRAMPAHIAYIDRHAIYRFSNDRFSQVMGIKRGDLVGKNIAEVFPAQLARAIFEQLESALKGQSITFSHEVTGRDGKTESIRTTLSPDFNEAGEPQGAFVQSLNVTDEIAANELQLHAKRMETTSKLTSGLAHDFSNILTVILGNLERIRKEAQGANFELVQSTEQAARRGTRIIDNLMSHIYRHQLDIKVTDVNLLLRDIVRLFSASLPASITIDLCAGEGPIVCKLDEGAFQDAILNVLFNARDAIETFDGEGAIHVSVGLTPAGEHIVVSIRDSGQGFPEDVMARAAEPFFTTKPQGKGTGLGLSMVKTFLEESGGSLAFSNASAGGGQVDLIIPYAAPAISQPRQRVSLPFEPQDQLVLVVDDDAELRALIGSHLSTMNIKSMEAGSPEEALALIAQVPSFTAVITDIVMPGGRNGLVLARDLARDYPGLGLMLVSGLPHHDPLMEDARADFTVLRKPFDALVFTQTIQSVLAQLSPAVESET